MFLFENRSGTKEKLLCFAVVEQAPQTRNHRVQYGANYGYARLKLSVGASDNEPLSGNFSTSLLEFAYLVSPDRACLTYILSRSNHWKG